MEGVFLRGVEVSESLEFVAGDADSFLEAVVRLAHQERVERMWLVLEADGDTHSMWLGSEPDAAIARGREVQTMRRPPERN